MRGVGTAYGITLWCFALASLSLIGIPPTGGFSAKWLLAEGALAVLEWAAPRAVALPPGFSCRDESHYGETCVGFVIEGEEA